jgi:hypothetical protein
MTSGDDRIAVKDAGESAPTVQYTVGPLVYWFSATASAVSALYYFDTFYDGHARVQRRCRIWILDSLSRSEHYQHKGPTCTKIR